MLVISPPLSASIGDQVLPWDVVQLLGPVKHQIPDEALARHWAYVQSLSRPYPHGVGKAKCAERRKCPALAWLRETGTRILGPCPASKFSKDGVVLRYPAADVERHTASRQ